MLATFSNTETLTNIDSASHVTGRSVYVDDVPLLEGTLFAKIFDSPHAHGIIKKLDYSIAESMEGVVAIFAARDIPAANQIGGIVQDEPLMAQKEVIFRGQPLLLIVAINEDIAEDALKTIEVDIEPLEIAG